MKKFLGMAPIAGLLLAMTGCGGSDTPAPGTDGGMNDMSSTGDMTTGDMTTTGDMSTDARTDMGTASLPTCASPHMVTGVLDTTSSVMLDTTGGPEGTLVLTECGSTEQVAPQAVVAYVVPGTGDVSVGFTTDTAGSAEDFDTIVQVINGPACTEEPVDNSGCFDDIDYPDNVKSAGAVTAVGGSTIFFVVTGYGDTAGEVQLDITPFINEPPVLTSATFNVGTYRAYARVVGTDPTGDVTGMTARFLNAEGETIDLNDDGMVDAGDTIQFPFSESLTGMEAFTADQSFYGENVTLLTDLHPTSVVVTLVDVAEAMSAPLTVAITYNADWIGATCSAEAPCGDAPEIECAAGTCAPVAAVGTLCSGATAITVATPAAGASSSASATGTTALGESVVGGTCQTTHLTPAAFSVVVPEGAYDLIARTDVTGSAMEADTVLSVRSTCNDLTTEVGCNDDVSTSEEAPDTRSRVEVLNAAAGTYAIFVDQFVGSTPPTAGLPFGVEVTLRSVLGEGATCDPAGVMNRCSTGACPATGTAVCPAAVPPP